MRGHASRAHHVSVRRGVRRLVPGTPSTMSSTKLFSRQAWDQNDHEVGCEERKRDRHIDLSNAAFVASSNLLDIGHGASNDPASGVMRHADAGYDEAIACA